MNKLIEKILERITERSKYALDVDMSCRDYENFKEAISIIHEEAKAYNEEVCEWHKVKNGKAYKSNTHAEIHDSRVLDWCVCPYCGKKIKVWSDDKMV